MRTWGCSFVPVSMIYFLLTGTAPSIAVITVYDASIGSSKAFNTLTAFGQCTLQQIWLLDSFCAMCEWYVTTDEAYRQWKWYPWKLCRLNPWAPTTSLLWKAPRTGGCRNFRNHSKQWRELTSRPIKLHEASFLASISYDKPLRQYIA